ncbi:MAG: GGDEF domain-containing protein [Gammaproteobacteria bacterium]|nr:GGDEF domain-containing protein [Gammaproteobacteria bacterium]
MRLCRLPLMGVKCDIGVSSDNFYRDFDRLFVSKQQELNDGQGIEPLCRISAGVICIKNGAQYGVKQLMEQADCLLYEAKHAGRTTIRYAPCE